MASTDAASVFATRPGVRATAPTARLAGTRTIFRKEFQEWFRTRRFLVTTIVATLVVAAIPTGVWLVDHDGLTAGRATLAGPEAVDARGSGIGTLLSLSTYLAIVLTMGMLVKEREAGTAQWVFTKPVSRIGYGLAKWAANGLGVVLATVLVPGAVGSLLVTAMYEVPGWSWADQALATGAVVVHAVVVVALMLMLGTLFRSTVPVAVTALGLSVAPAVMAPVLGAGFLRVLPVFGLRDLVADVANGRTVGAGDVMPLAAGLVFLPLCLAVAGRRLTREQFQ